MAENRVLWINDLSGSINQATAPHLLSDNQFKLLVNVDQTEIGAVGHRLGSELYLDLKAGAGPVRGLHMYEKADGSRYLHMVAGGNLYVTDETNDEWDSQDAAQWNAASEVDMVNFINRHYMIGTGAAEYLVYADDNTSAVTTVTGDITGKYLAANGPYLVVVDPANNKAYWSDPADDNFDTGTNFANINGLATGVGSFGIGRPFVVFTNNNYLVVDPANISTSEVRGFGCVSHRSIQAIRGHLIFLGRDGFYQLRYNDSFPIEISRVVRNELKKDSIFNKIDGSNWEVTASGVLDSRYFCAVRDLSGNVEGYDLDDVVIEYDVASETVKVHTFTQGGIGTVFAQFINEDGDLDLYAGSIDTRAVYKLFPSDTFTDENSGGSAAAVTARLITKDHAFFNTNKRVVSMQNVERLHFKYQADNALTVKYSLDGNETYTTLPTTLPATTAGTKWEYQEIAFGEECKTISLDISGTGEWMIYGFGYEISSLDNTGIDLI